MLQEPCQQKNKPPPDHPDFTIFSPSTKNPKCAAYIRLSACLQPYIHFQYSNFAIAITIQPIDHTPVTIYNVYSPGRPIHAASHLPGHIPKLLAIFMGDSDAHHQWWYGSEAANTIQINPRKHSERIVDWLEQSDFSLHNTQGTYTHFPRQSGANPSIIDLTLTSGINPDCILRQRSDSIRSRCLFSTY
jgi:hypothetical protein